MIEKVGHVRNPLTIIAISAGLAEVGGTVVLPLLEPVTQSIYVWFLMLFPMGLVGIFFFVLYKKHHVLYAPSDFKEDNTFLDLLESQSVSQRLESLKWEVEESAEEEQSESTGDGSTISALDVMQRDYRAKYLLAEELAIVKLSKDRNLNIRRNVAERGKSHGGFDGAAESTNYDYIIEVSYTRRNWMTSFWKHRINQVSQFFDNLSHERKNRFRAIFAIVYDREDKERLIRAVERVQRLVADLPYNVEVVTFCYEDLTDEFELR
ncbi:hypothetical protein [Gimesia sp.]|uniref:hypothetical protein n=1 Tax=Gimesia sp. TaxID=2024833 RepID=UPI003A9067FA